MITLQEGNIRALVNPGNQQLCSLKIGSEELLHGAALPVELQTPADKLGWNQTEIVMFPVIGPVKDNVLIIDGKQYPMAQHGIVRHRQWKLVEQTENSVTYQQRYDANTPVPNSKIKTPLSWPWSFEITKRYWLEKNALLAEFEVKNLSKTPMPYAIGWHPAFKALAINAVAGGKSHSMDEIHLISMKKAVELKQNAASYGNIHVTSNMHHLMLWSPMDSQMICIEPITHFPVWEGVENLDHYHRLGPGETTSYIVEVRVS